MAEPVLLQIDPQLVLPVLPAVAADAAPAAAAADPMQIILDPPMTISEKKTASIIHKACDKLFHCLHRSQKKMWGGERYSRDIDGGEFNAMWDLWTLPDTEFAKRDGYGVSEAIEAKQLLHIFFPTFAAAIEVLPPPRDAFRRFATVAARYGQSVLEHLEIFVEKWRQEPYATLWRLAIKDMEEEHGGKHGFYSTWGYDKFIGYKVATILDAFKNDRLHVKLKWGEKKAEKVEVHKVLALGLHDSSKFNYAFRVRIAWPVNDVVIDANNDEASRGSELVVFSMTKGNTWRHSCARLFHETGDCGVRMTFVEEDKSAFKEEWDLVVPIWFRKACRAYYRSHTDENGIDQVPPVIHYPPIEMVPDPVEVPSLFQLFLMQTFAARDGWFQMTIHQQRKVALDIGLTLIDSLSLKRARSAEDVTISASDSLQMQIDEERDREEKESPELAKQANSQRQEERQKKRPRLPLFGE